MDAGRTDKNTRLCECWGGNNHFLTPVHYWIHDCIRDWHPELDPEVVSRVEYEDSVAQ